MTDERQNIPVDGDDNEAVNTPLDEEAFVDNFIEDSEEASENVPQSEAAASTNGVNTYAPRMSAPEDTDIPKPPSMPAEQPQAAPPDDRMGQRLERLGGEPAPVITPEEFARLQKSGQVNIDARGRVRTARPDDAEAGVSLRKRRAWYGGANAISRANMEN